MTSEEAKQKVSSCERDIRNAYNGLWGSAKELGNAGCYVAQRAKSRIEDEAYRNTLIKVGLSVLVIIFGVILCMASHPGWGSLLVIGGIVLACKW